MKMMREVIEERDTKMVYIDNETEIYHVSRV